MSPFWFKWIGVILFLFLLITLMNFQLILLIQPKILFIIILGTLILGGTQKITAPKISWLMSFRLNSLFASFLVTLVYLLAYATSPTIGFEQTLIPILYGGLIYVVLGYVRFNTEEASATVTSTSDPFEVSVVSKILTAKGFSPREIHVALKIMHHLPNKEIAKDLFISEATVKKHIQNMFKKCDAQDRNQFTQIYLQWYNEH